MTLIDKDQLGRVRTLEDGRRYVEFERVLMHSVDNVWAAIIDPEQRAVWFPGFRAEFKLGGRFDMWFGGECEGPSHYGGEITRFDPPNFLQCGTIGFELTEHAEGCLLKFTDILWNHDAAQSETELANSVLGGWHQMLDSLTAALNGEPFDLDGPEVNYAALEIPGREVAELDTRPFS